jgi:hypothetical protein
LSLLRGVLALWVALSCMTCSLVISGESAPLHCSAEGQRGPPACDEGFICRRGLCRADAAGGAGMSGAAAEPAGQGGAGLSDGTAAGRGGDSAGGAAGQAG